MDDENVIKAPETGSEIPDEEVVEEIVEVAPEESEESEIEEPELEEGEAAPDPDVVPTVSGGDSYPSFYSDIDSESLQEIKTLLETNNTMLSEYQQEQQLTIWEKDINDYTPVEGMLLIILCFVVIYFLYKLIGGVIHVKPFN